MLTWHGSGGIVHLLPRGVIVMLVDVLLVAVVEVFDAEVVCCSHPIHIVNDKCLRKLPDRSC